MAQNVKVCARYRPPNRIEKAKGSKLVVQVSENRLQCIIKDPDSHKKGKDFNFDRVFKWDSTQEEVYKYSASPLVENVMGGYNVTMFAYGQTGSGKTFTMEGTEDMPGIIPRMVQHIFDVIFDNTERVEYLVRVSYVEIYNEKIRDLLEPSSSDLRVREHRTKGVYIEDAAEPYTNSPEEVLDIMGQGHLNRAVTATGMNDTSSRSHAVFVLHLEQRNTDTDTKKASKLMLVDLAGSEKVRKTGATGKVMEEAKNINRSLSCLGMVINHLTEGKTHIPYRDSKLTRLLSDSLGGNSKTCIIVTASPCIYNIEETISTMRFGTNCKRVKNKAKVNQELSVAQYKKMVASLQRRIQSLEENNTILKAQVNALKNALVSGDSNVDLDSLLANAAADTGLDVDEEEVVGLSQKSTGAGSEEQQQKIDTLEDQKENLEDQVVDLRSELEIAENQYATSLEEIETMQRRYNQLEEICKSLKAESGQLTFYKEKVEYLEREQQQTEEDYQRRLREARRQVEQSMGVTMDADLEDTEMELENLEMQISTDQPVPYEMFERFKEKQEEKYRNVISKMKAQLDEAKQIQDTHDDLKEIENINVLSSDEKDQTVHKLLTEKQEMRRKVTELQGQNEKYGQQMRAFTQREQYNDKLRRNWQTQLRQMEQALLLSNQINNQNRAKYQQTITEKDSEIAKLRAYVTHQLHRQRTMRRGTRIAKPIKAGAKGRNPPKPIGGRHPQ